MSEVNDNRAFGKQNNVNRGYDGVGLLDNNKYHIIGHLLNNNKNKMIESIEEFQIFTKLIDKFAWNDFLKYIKRRNYELADYEEVCKENNEFFLNFSEKLESIDNEQKRLLPFYEKDSGRIEKKKNMYYVYYKYYLFLEKINTSIEKNNNINRFFKHCFHGETDLVNILVGSDKRLGKYLVSFENKVNKILYNIDKESINNDKEANRKIEEENKIKPIYRTIDSKESIYNVIDNANYLVPLPIFELLWKINGCSDEEFKYIIGKNKSHKSKEEEQETLSKLKRKLKDLKADFIKNAPEHLKCLFTYLIDHALYEEFLKDCTKRFNEFKRKIEKLRYFDGITDIDDLGLLSKRHIEVDETQADEIINRIKEWVKIKKMTIQEVEQKLCKKNLIRDLKNKTGNGHIFLLTSDLKEIADCINVDFNVFLDDDDTKYKKVDDSKIELEQIYTIGNSDGGLRKILGDYFIEQIDMMEFSELENVRKWLKDGGLTKIAKVK